MNTTKWNSISLQHAEKKEERKMKPLYYSPVQEAPEKTKSNKDNIWRDKNSISKIEKCTTFKFSIALGFIQNPKEAEPKTLYLGTTIWLFRRSLNRDVASVDRIPLNDSFCKRRSRQGWIVRRPAARTVPSWTLSCRSSAYCQVVHPKYFIS